MIKKRITMLLAAVLMLSSLVTGCGDDEDDFFAAIEAEEDDDDEDESYEDEEDKEETGKLFNISSVVEDGSVEIFIGEPFYDGTVSDEEEALDVLYKLIEYLGGDDNTELELDAIDGPSAEGNTYYTFHQMAGNIKVSGASVKMVTDKDGYPIGLNSTLSTGIDSLGDAFWSVDEDEAEAIVKNELRESDVDAKIIPGVTEQTLLPDEEDPGTYYYVWIVYTQNPFDDIDTAYLAHYVSSDGEYLYVNPVTSPGDSEEMSSAGATFSFDGLEADTWSGTVKKYHGETMEITVPVAKDSKTGDIYLADVDRRIMCADYFEFYNEDTISPRKLTKGKFTDSEVIIYNSMIEVYDFFEGIGWKGADGNGAPTLLLMDWVDENGDPVHNACYSGKMQGFEVFQFNRDEPDGEAYDIIAHEFTHGLTSTSMVTNLYMNDYGAINEAMSDIFGNLVESLLDKTEDKTWLIQENGINPIRSMSSPHDFEQPEFVWDKYYVPSVGRPSNNNDNGGVHINSSLLNLIAYRLNESGMDESDQLYFWQNVALILTPRTDYKMISKILPWSLKIVGMEEYMDVLTAAIEETGIADSSLPDSIPSDLAMFKLVFPDHDILDAYDLMVVACNAESGDTYLSWAEDKTDVVAIMVSPGQYSYSLLLESEEEELKIQLFKTEDGWAAEEYDEPDFEGGSEEDLITISGGQIIEFDSDELNEFLSE